MAIEMGVAVVGLAECKTYLRLERDDDDALLAGLVRTATSLCEAFIGQWLIQRVAEQRLGCTTDWQRLAAVPVAVVTGVIDGCETLPAEAFCSDIDQNGCGFVQLAAPQGLLAPVAQFRAGLAVDWNGVPEPLRQGIVRLVGHLYTHRDAADAGPPPAAVAAMWRPWRRMRLG
jgi:uncharacterized phiE125 gp8 family phage protein